MAAPRKPSRGQHAATARGYTAVEVLMAMTIMAIGAAAVMSMQKAAIQGNLDARKTDLANSIARTWVERLQRDAMNWTMPSSAYPTGDDFAAARLIQPYVGKGWYLPTALMKITTPETMSPGFDILGRDVEFNDLPNAQFCVNVRLTWLTPPALTASPVEPGLIRADVRVLWPRALFNSPLGGSAGGFCIDDVASQVNPDVYTAGTQPQYHAIYLTTILTENPAP
jgi:prepilin-type N-terminal cleavage/methylation domain-containing protein